MNTTDAQFRLAEIEVNKSTVDEKIIGLFRYESESKTGGKRGPVLIMAEIHSTLYVYEQLLDTINEAAEQLRLLIAGVEADPMVRFEKMVQRLNEAIMQFSAKEPTPIAWNRVNIFLLQLSEGQLCFSGVGRLMNVFLQKQDDGTFRSFDLFGSLEQPAEVNPQKPFSSIVCGDLKPGDLLFVGTSNFERLRNELDIVNRLKKSPPVTAALEIRQELDRKEIPEDFTGIVIASVMLPTKPAAVAPPSFDDQVKEKSTESIVKMHSEEQATQTILSPTGTGLTAPPAPKKSWQDQLKSPLMKAKSSVEQMLTRPQRTKDPMVMTSLRGMNAGHGSFMTKKRKRTIAIAVAVVVLLVGGFLWYRHAQKVATEQKIWNMAQDQVTTRKNQIEADLVYGNEEHARRLLAEADKLLKGMNEATAERKSSKAALVADLNVIRTKLKRIIQVDHPVELVTLPLNTPANQLQSLAYFKEKIYTVDASSKELLQVESETHDIKKIPLSTSSTTVIASGSTKDTLYLLQDRRRLAIYDAKNERVTSIGSGMKKATSTTALAFFNNRAYVLDPDGNMIWKYAAASTGFTQESAYLRQNTTPFANATTLAIDSDVYVAFADGKIKRYLAGAEEIWNPGPVEPPLTNATSLWTTPDTDRLVVTDTIGKRILVYRKDGHLIAQILSDALQAPTTVTGNDVTKKIYVIDGNRVLVFDLP